jgi:hypothetical protein
MPETHSAPHLREAVAVFTQENSLQEAIDELLSHGFDRADISLLASEKAVERKLGHHFERVQDVEDDPEVERTVYVSKESLGDAEGGAIGGLFYVGACVASGIVVASGGTLAAAIIAAAVTGGVGGLIGAMFASWLDDNRARHLEEQLEHGGLLLWVRTPDADREARAVEILQRHSGRDVHVHGVPDVAAAQ